MTSLYPYCEDIRLHVAGRISEEDATRQERTAREILKRLSSQPGLILADEVGMGKTFVSLAVAVSVARANRGRQPVVVMVPPSLKEKWPTDFSMFCERCLPERLRDNIRAGRADSAVQFLKLLDDPPERHSSVIFLTHGAMSRGLDDHWVMLALIWRTLHKRRDVQRLRNALCRIMGDLLQQKWIDHRDAGLWERLLAKHPSQWLPLIQTVVAEEDDPVPQPLLEIFKDLNKEAVDPVYEALCQIPLRRSPNFHSYVVQARRRIKEELRRLWQDCLPKMKRQLPLLILDEAHHLKNADTRLASLFRTSDAAADAEQLDRGPLAGIFERMLFLTATPFQLGHAELCSVLDRFDGISWTAGSAPPGGREAFASQRQALRDSLDAAQEAAVTLDCAWGRLRAEDLVVGETKYDDVEQWWPAARSINNGELTTTATDVIQCFERAKTRLGIAEEQLRPWVIRHLKPRLLPGSQSGNPRRRRLAGRAIHPDCADTEQDGIAVSGEDLLPFLLAARAAAQAPESRPVFAEGLASSYEAFLHTRKARLSKQPGAERELDGDDEGSENDSSEDVTATDALNWYLDRLESIIPRDGRATVAHPKVNATIRRVVDAWRLGEKVVVFCHFIATGRILRQQLSAAIHREIRSLGAQRLRCNVDAVDHELELVGRRFFDNDSPLRRACDSQSANLIGEFPALAPHKDDLVEIIRRNVRTPSFLVRFFPLDRDKLDEDAMEVAWGTRDLSGLTMRQLLRGFLHFLANRCSHRERENYIAAVKRIQTGTHFGSDATSEYEDDELQGAAPEQLLPNVRLVNGTTRPETRQRLMLTFNTPFYPEVLIASSVMAEGVDLHLNCRYVIHHDLCWNPSTLEQRTGRVDRIGAKAEHAGQPIHVYLPFVAETQDEKMYRVVMDRERWFSVVMGEDYRMDTKTTEKLASRIPFPESAASELAFKLEVYISAASETGVAEQTG